MASRPSLLTVAVLGAAGLVACGDGDGDGRAGTTAGPAGAEVVIEDFEYRPAEVTVAAGTTLTFTNEDGQAHTATATADAGGGFDSGSIAAGEPATVEVAEPGRYPYHCSFHPFMTGTVIVE